MARNGRQDYVWWDGFLTCEGREQHFIYVTDIVAKVGSDGEYHAMKQARNRQWCDKCGEEMKIEDPLPEPKNTKPFDGIIGIEQA